MNTLLKKFLEKNRQKTISIHCVGDAMIDEYYKVKINRISPEHPVPVMVCQNQVVRRPGGSANVAFQCKHLNTDVRLVCFYDQDAFGVFEQHNIETLSLKNSDYLCSLPIKRRYLDNGIQVAPRHDFEKTNCGLNQYQIDNLISLIPNFIEKNKPDVAILSDYNKGFFKSKYNLIDFYQGVKTIVDPKNGPLNKWKGCSVFKPNSKEAEQLTGLINWQDQARFLYDQLECQAVVITFGGEKVAGIFEGQEFIFCPKKNVNVESVIGAGDCFAAFFAVAIAHDFSPIEASEISWEAGSVYVQQRMNRPVVPAELVNDKIVHPLDLRKRDFKLVFTNGCFDVLHKGHLETLNFSKAQGDKLVVALNSDSSVKRLKGDARPVLPLEHRMAALAAMEVVDFVVSFEEDTPIEAIRQIMPDVLVKGDGYQPQSVIGSDVVPDIRIAPTFKYSSTTKFIEEYLQRKITS